MPVLELTRAAPQVAVALAQLCACGVLGGEVRMMSVAWQQSVPYVEQERGFLSLRGTGLLRQVLGSDPRWQAVCSPSKAE